MCAVIAELYLTIDSLYVQGRSNLILNYCYLAKSYSFNFELENLSNCYQVSQNIFMYTRLIDNFF